MSKARIEQAKPTTLITPLIRPGNIEQVPVIPPLRPLAIAGNSALLTVAPRMPQLPPTELYATGSRWNISMVNPRFLSALEITDPEQLAIATAGVQLTAAALTASSLLKLITPPAAPRMKKKDGVLHQDTTLPIADTVIQRSIGTVLRGDINEALPVESLQARVSSYGNVGKLGLVATTPSLSTFVNLQTTLVDCHATVEMTAGQQVDGFTEIFHAEDFLPVERLTLAIQTALNLQAPTPPS